jgi:hypothetical protein
MQVEKYVRGQKGKTLAPAANMSKQEFYAHMQQITAIVHAWWIRHGIEGTPIMMYDCPYFHDLKSWQLQALHLGKGNVERPPRYSGDFMQCIEHVHAYVCAAFDRDSFEAGNPVFDMEADFARMKACFEAKVTPEGVTRNCRKVMRLVRYIVQQGTGGYAPAKMT